MAIAAAAATDGSASPNNMDAPTEPSRTGTMREALSEVVRENPVASKNGCNESPPTTFVAVANVNTVPIAP